MASNVVIDEMFPDESGTSSSSYMEVDEGQLLNGVSSKDVSSSSATNNVCICYLGYPNYFVVVEITFQEGTLLFVRCAFQKTMPVVGYPPK